jgi:hypothetical protein
MKSNWGRNLKWETRLMDMLIGRIVGGKIVSAVLLVVTLAACASAKNPGWTSSANATPLDRATQECQDRTQSTHGPGFEECMASLGWRRAQP